MRNKEQDFGAAALVRVSQTGMQKQEEGLKQEDGLSSEIFNIAACNCEYKRFNYSGAWDTHQCSQCYRFTEGLACKG